MARDGILMESKSQVPLPYFDAVRKRMTALMYDVTMTHYQDAMEALPPQKSNQE